MPSIAFVHEWLVVYAGSERALGGMLENWPDAPVYTLVHDPHGECHHLTQGRQVMTSFIQRLPFATRKYRSYLPLMPLAIEQFDLRGYDVVISCSHAVAHGILTQPSQMHINYICIPMRYAWHLYHQYLQESGLDRGFRSIFARLTLHYLRLWDAATANRVDQYVAISRWVADNVWRTYRRSAHVIYPPVDVEAFPFQEKKEDFYLTVSRLVPYKKIDLIVQAFRSMPEKKLIVIGDGPDHEKIRSQASSNVELLGYQPHEKMVSYMQNARAFIFAAEEDFGIAPIEAQACGTPVIAYGKGGARETILEDRTGVFFNSQTPEELVQAIQRFEAQRPGFDAHSCRLNAERFNKERFKREIREYVEKRWEEFQGKPGTNQMRP